MNSPATQTTAASAPAQATPAVLSGRVRSFGLDWADFTPSEQACISRKISEKVDDGEEPSDQDLAITISECAPDKARQARAGAWHDALQSILYQVEPTYRSRYETETLDGGKVAIRDVPIFSAHVRGGRDYDRQWLEAALRQHQYRRDRGYEPPLHVHHHDRGQSVEVEWAGTFVAKEIRSFEYEGIERPTIFADLIVPEEIAHRIQRGELRAVSIESLDVEKPEIDSLALLSDEVPYFRYPNLSPSDADLAADASHETVELYTGLPAEEDSMPDDAVTYEDEEEDMEDEDYMDEDEEQAQEGGSNLGAIISEMEQCLARVQEAQGADAIEEAAKLEELASKLASALGGKSEPEPEDEDDEGGMVIEEPAGMSADAGSDPELLARVDRLESEWQAEKQKRKRQEKVDEAIESLRPYGIPEKKTRERLQAMAREKGPEAVDSYVQAWKDRGLPDDAPTWEDATGSPPSDPPAVSAYASAGPDALAEARKLAREYHTEWSATMKRSTDLKDYLRASLGEAPGEES